MRFPRRHPSGRVVEYDAISRRLWILGQRCHHGGAGALVACIACARLASTPSEGISGLLLALTGGALMAHDWRDRSLWFRPGHQG
jgi:hypothetical protein